MNKRSFSERLAAVTTSRPWTVLTAGLLLCLAAGWLGSRLEVNMQMANMLPADSEVAQAYLSVSRTYAEANTVIALEGPRGRIVPMARELEARLQDVPGLYNIQASMPEGFILDHGLMVQTPEDLERSLRTLGDPRLLEMLRRLNEDYESEYTSDEGNLQDDELDVARSMLGMHRSLEVLAESIAGDRERAPLKEAVDALLIGEPWQLSLDRRMLLISIMPDASLMEQDDLIEIAERLEALLEELRPSYPQVEANLTGAGPLQRDEVQSINRNTLLLTLLALVLIYLLLARTFRGWVLPVLAILPLVAGILWTMAGIFLLFGDLNLFTAMIMLVLMGLGIDFSIHLVSRFYEERAAGADIRGAAQRMIATTGRGVFTGGLTTSVAFFALMVADTRGVFELGVSSGLGVLLTLIAVFTLLPALLALRERIAGRLFGGARGTPRFSKGAASGSPLLGRIAVASYRRPALVLPVTLVLLALGFWGALENEVLYDWLKLEPEGLKNVQLQREIPRRFGVTDQGAWSVAPTVAESRRRAEAFRDLPAVGMVSSISDLLPDSAWLPGHRRKLAQLRASLEASPRQINPGGGRQELLGEVIRFWDNLDLMSNLAFQAGIDRVVRTIDNITGYNSETNSTDPAAVLPTLVRLLEDEELPQARLDSVRSAWLEAARPRLLRMASATAPTLASLPPTLRRQHLPRGSEEEGPFLLTVSARRYLFEREALETFNRQTERVDERIISMPKIAIVMMDETLKDGRTGALLALGVIALLLLLHFRSPVGLVALVPLLGGVVLMVGVMYLVGIKYNFMNLIAVPIILGIGIDDGVHALHRWLEEGGNGIQRSYESFRFVGRAIALTSLTTMVGFGSLGFYAMRGISTFGIFLFLGVGFCFLTTLLVLPAVLRVFTRSSPDPQSE